MDHVNPTAARRVAAMPDPGGARQVEYFAQNCRAFGIEPFDVLHRLQGIEHVVAPELGLILPGMAVAAGDSHNRIEPGGWARETTVRELPVSTAMAGVNMRLDRVVSQFETHGFHCHREAPLGAVAIPVFTHELSVLCPWIATLRSR